MIVVVRGWGSVGGDGGVWGRMVVFGRGCWCLVEDGGVW